MQKEDEQGGPPNSWTFLFFPPLGEPSSNLPKPGVVPYFWPGDLGGRRGSKVWPGPTEKPRGFCVLENQKKILLISLALEFN